MKKMNCLKKGVAALCTAVAVVAAMPGIHAYAASVGTINLHYAEGAGIDNVTYQSWSFITRSSATVMSLTRVSVSGSFTVHLYSSTGISDYRTAPGSVSVTNVELGRSATAIVELQGNGSYAYVNGTVTG